jgi:hypothetical protein
MTLLVAASGPERAAGIPATRAGGQPVTLRRACALPLRRRLVAVARARPPPRCCAGALVTRRTNSPPSDPHAGMSLLRRNYDQTARTTNVRIRRLPARCPWPSVRKSRVPHAVPRERLHDRVRQHLPARTEADSGHLAPEHLRYTEGMTEMTTIKVSVQTRDRLKRLADEEHLTMDAALSRVLDKTEDARFWEGIGAEQAAIVRPPRGRSGGRLRAPGTSHRSRRARPTGRRTPDTPRIP